MSATRSAWGGEAARTVARHVRSIALAAGVVAAAGSVAAGGLPPLREQTLGNGLRVVIAETREVPLVSFRLLVPAGSALDGDGREGVANLTGRLLLKGADGRTAEQIAEAIEEVGGALSAETGRDVTCLRGQFLAKDFDRALGILAQVVLHPTFTPEEVEREKTLIAAEIAGEKEDPRGLTAREFERVLLSGHPYAHPVTGSTRSVGGLTRDTVAEFHRRRYVPAGAILAIVGDVDAADALARVEQRFAGWRGKDAQQDVPALAVRAFPGRKVYVIDKPDATQSQIRIGNIAVPRNTPDYFPLIVTNTLLGGGFTSRLMEEIRVNRGLSYGARSDLDFLKRGGFFSVATFTDNRTLRETIDVALAQLERIRSEPITQPELASWQQHLSGLFPFDLERGEDLARWITDLTYHEIPLAFLTDYPAAVRAVTPEACQEAARQHFWANDNVMLLLTNYEETKEQLAGLGEIQVVRLSEIE